MKLISLVISAYNEEGSIQNFYKEASAVLGRYISENAGYSYELCFVNDGSRDKTGELLSGLHQADPEHVSVVTFARNFGHEAAMTAGLDYASGDYLIFLDADLQHPPKLIPEIMKNFESGCEVISMARTQNKTAGLIKNITSNGFYWLINKISSVELTPGASDFFAVNKAAADVLRKNYRGRVRFLRGYVQSIGFHKTVMEYEAAPRTAGESHYSIMKLLKFSIDIIMCFSDLPLMLGIYAGVIAGLLGVLHIIAMIVRYVMSSAAPTGYDVIILALCFFFAVLFILIGIIGKYLTIIFKNLADAPIYIERSFDQANTANIANTAGKSSG